MSNGRRIITTPRQNPVHAITMVGVVAARSRRRIQRCGYRLNKWCCAMGNPRMQRCDPNPLTPDGYFAVVGAEP
jgi:hypothetical protein